VRVFTIGRSEEGRDIVLLAIADEDGIAQLDGLKAATAALADPRKTDSAAADRLIASFPRHLLFQRRDPLRRNRFHRVGA
jgi:hypothetical protein